MRLGVNTLFLIPGEVGGSQTYLCETLRALAAERPDWELVFFTQRENDALLRATWPAPGRARFVPLDFRAARRPVRILREQLELPRQAARARVDVLWSPGYTAPVLAPMPQAVTIHDMQYRRFPHDLTPAARIATDLLVRAAARRCRRILTVSAFSRSEILRFTAAAPERIDVTHEAADARYAEPVAPAARHAWLAEHLPGVEHFLLCVAHTYPHKNVGTLVRAFGALGPDFPGHLVLVGKPRLGEPAVRQALAELPDPRRARRLEHVAFDDLRVLYQSCAAMVFPSLYEGFGLPVLEAMMAGAPVLAARIPTVEEIGGAHVGFFNGHRPDELAAALRGLLHRAPEERARQTGAAREYARGFSWARTARETAAALERALAGPAAPAPGVSR